MMLRKSFSWFSEKEKMWNFFLSIFWFEHYLCNYGINVCKNRSKFSAAFSELKLLEGFTIKISCCRLTDSEKSNNSAFFNKNDSIGNYHKPSVTISTSFLRLSDAKKFQISLLLLSFSEKYRAVFFAFLSLTIYLYTPAKKTYSLVVS